MLAAFDDAHTASALHDAARQTARQSLVAEARAALWNFVVQREACGLRDARQVILDYRVPAEVQHAVAVPPVMRRGAR